MLVFLCVNGGLETRVGINYVQVIPRLHSVSFRGLWPNSYKTQFAGGILRKRSDDRRRLTRPGCRRLHACMHAARVRACVVGCLCAHLPSDAVGPKIEHFDVSVVVACQQAPLIVVVGVPERNAPTLPCLHVSPPRIPQVQVRLSYGGRSSSKFLEWSC